jgi:hypothetical protein
MLDRAILYFFNIFFDFLDIQKFTLGELKIFSTWSGLEQGYPTACLDRIG